MSSIVDPPANGAAGGLVAGGGGSAPAGAVAATGVTGTAAAIGPVGTALRVAADSGGAGALATDTFPGFAATPAGPASAAHGSTAVLIPESPPHIAVPAQSASESSHRCANCGTPVPLQFCGKCGQRLEHAVHSVWHFLREVTEDLTHADSRLWQTLLALLVKPGFLTNEFLKGRRVRYLPPLRLYLVLSVVFFLLASLSQHSTFAKKRRKESEQTAVTQAMKDVADETAATVTEAVRDAADDTDARPATHAASSESATGGAPSPDSVDSKQQRLQRSCEKLPESSPSDFISPRRACLALNALSGHGDGSFREQILHNAPRAMFIFLPLLALGMKLTYWRPRRYYVEHLLFFVHSHAFVFLLFSLYILISLLVPWSTVSGLLEFAVWLYFPYYLYRSMRRVYGQGRALTLVKLTALSVYYFSCALVTVIFVAIYAALVV